MPRKVRDPNQNVEHKAKKALLIIDMINDLIWDGGPELVEPGKTAAKFIARLKKKARQANVPVIYVNDNFGQWRSDFRWQVQHCCSKKSPGSAISNTLKPTKQDYFILKPRHSAFHESPLRLLLDCMNTNELILTGLTTESCLLFTALEAHLYGYKVTIPVDCVVSASETIKNRALEQMVISCKLHKTESASIDFQ